MSSSSADSENRLIEQLYTFESTREFQSGINACVEDVLDTGHPLELVIIAEFCRDRGERWGAAQVYLRLLVLPDEVQAGAAGFLDKARQHIRTIRNQSLTFRNEGDFRLYCLAGLLDCLEENGIDEPDQRNWVRDAVLALSAVSGLTVDELTARLERVSENVTAAAPELRQALPPYVASFARSLKHGVAKETASEKPAGTGLIGRKITQFCAFAALSAITVYAFASIDGTSFPKASGLIFDIDTTFYCLVVLWPVLLVVTWLYAFVVSREAGVFSYVSPKYFIKPGKITVGEIMPFRRDLFYHIFQFFWLPYLAVCFLILSKIDALQATIERAWTGKASAYPSADGFIELWNAKAGLTVPAFDGIIETLRDVLTNDLYVAVLAFAVCLYWMYNQERIQSSREAAPINLYWWDRRISRSEWTIRLIMVGLDGFLALALLGKVLAISLLAFELTSQHVLDIQVFHPDGVGGLLALSTIFENILWLIFLFGIFVMASLYLHKDMAEYRITDLIIVAVYAVLVGLAMLPLLFLEFRLGDAHSAVLAQFAAAPLSASMSIQDAVQLAEGLEALKRWKLTALNFGFFGGPIAPLISQAAIIAAQYFIRNTDSKKGRLREVLKMFSGESTP